MTTTHSRTRSRTTDETLCRDGVYELHYRCAGRDHAGSDSLLLVMRQGHLLGADRWGGLVSGHCRFDSAIDRHRFEVVFDALPGGVLVTGEPAPTSAAPIELVTDLNDGGKAKGAIDLFGASIQLELEYRGPLPIPNDRRRPGGRA